MKFDINIMLLEATLQSLIPVCLVHKLVPRCFRSLESYVNVTL
jgi:hypothetical protein